ncbi:hypothetical protein Tco_0138509 [Tanacetum coccineum]
MCSLVPSIPRSSTAIFDRPFHDSFSASPSRKRSRSPTASVPLSSPTLGALYRGTDLEIDVDVVRSDGIDIDHEIQAEIDECIVYVDALRVRGIDARVVVEAVDQKETEASIRGPVEVKVDRVTHPVVTDDIPEPAQEGAVEVIYEILGDLVQRFHDHTEEISVRRVQLERDNKRLRDLMDVASQRVARH